MLRCKLAKAVTAHALTSGNASSPQSTLQHASPCAMITPVVGSHGPHQILTINGEGQTDGESGMCRVKPWTQDSKQPRPYHSAGRRVQGQPPHLIRLETEAIPLGKKACEESPSRVTLPRPQVLLGSLVGGLMYRPCCVTTDGSVRLTMSMISLGMKSNSFNAFCSTVQLLRGIVPTDLQGSLQPDRA